MNLVILSSIPKFAIVLIVLEAIVMIAIGGFLVTDIVRTRIKEYKKERQAKNERDYAAAQKSIEYEDSKESEEDIPEETKAHISYLERLNQQQREYVLLLEKELKLRKELQEMGADLPLASDTNNYVMPDEDDEFAAFIDSVPEKEKEEVISSLNTEEATPNEEVLNTTSLEDDNNIKPEEIKVEPKEEVILEEKVVPTIKKQAKPSKKTLQEIFAEEEEIINFRIVDPWYKISPSFKSNEEN